MTDIGRASWEYKEVRRWMIDASMSTVGAPQLLQISKRMDIKMVSELTGVKQRIGQHQLLLDFELLFFIRTELEINS